MSDYTFQEISDAMDDPSQRQTVNILIDGYLTDFSGIGGLLLESLKKSNIPEVRAYIEALQLSEDARPALSSYVHNYSSTDITPFRSTQSDRENIDTIMQHLGVKTLADAIRASLQFYAAIIRGDGVRVRLDSESIHE